MNLYSKSKNWHNWTETAVDCYRRGCVCDGCNIFKIIGEKCNMKRTVLDLVKKFGAPNNNEKTLTKGEQKIIDAILAGADDYKSIEYKTKMTHYAVQATLSHLYQYAKSEGFIFEDRKFMLPEFIRWVREGE